MDNRKDSPRPFAIRRFRQMSNFLIGVFLAFWYLLHNVICFDVFSVLEKQNQSVFRFHSVIIILSKCLNLISTHSYKAVTITISIIHIRPLPFFLSLIIFNFSFGLAKTF